MLCTETFILVSAGDTHVPYYGNYGQAYPSGPIAVKNKTRPVSFFRVETTLPSLLSSKASYVPHPHEARIPYSLSSSNRS